MREYLISAPPYAHVCNGIKMLHFLCHKLNERGYKAYMPCGYTNPEFNTPLASNLDQEHLRDLQHNGIIVYPDIVPNNPCRFTNCAKWWVGITLETPINQIGFSFSDMHQEFFQTKYNLSFVYIEDFFKEPEIENRYTSCAYVGKGRILEKIVPEIGSADVNPFDTINSDCVRITNGYPQTRQEVAKLLQSSKCFYSYDNLTIMNTEARMCGTPVILMGHWTVSEEQFKKDPFGMYGIGMYDDKPDLEKLKSEIPLCRELVQKERERMEKELDIFIEETQKWNPNNIYIEDLPSIEHMGLYGHPQLELWRTR